MTLPPPLRVPRPGVVALLAVLILALGGLGADAHTWRHGTTVWGHDVTLGEGDVVRGDLSVVGGSVVCGDGAVVQGDVRTYFGSFEQRDGCTVGGTVNDTFDSSSLGSVAPWLLPSDATSELMAENRRVIEHFAYAIIVVLVFLLFPLRTRVALERVEKHPGLAGAVGTLAAIAVIPLAILLAITIIGIPLIVVEIAGFFALLWIGQAAVALLVGRRLYELIRPHATPTPLGALLLGLVLTSAAELLPVVGWAVTAIVSLVGLGSAILAFARERQFGVFARPAGPGGPPGGPPPPSAPMKTA